jgi:hypothetical protein
MELKNILSLTLFMNCLIDGEYLPYVSTTSNIKN